MEIVFHLRGSVRHDEDQGLWVSYCTPLDQWARGNTKSGAKEALRESVSLFLTTCYENDKLDCTLKSVGLTTVDAKNDPSLRAHVANPLMDAFGESFDFEASIALVTAAVAD